MAPLPARDRAGRLVPPPPAEEGGGGGVGPSARHSMVAVVYSRESNLAISSSPVTKIMYRFDWAYCCHMKRREISSSAPGLSVMTLRECRVDRPFPVT